MATMNFPSDIPVTPGPAFDDTGEGISLGFIVAADQVGVTTEATGIRFYSPAALTVAPFLWTTSGTQLATGPSVACVAGWNSLPFSAPYAMTNGVDVIAGIFQATTRQYTAASGVFPVALPPLVAQSDPPSLWQYSTTPGLSLANSGESHSWFGIDLVVNTTANPLPTANAGADQLDVEAGTQITLSGSATNSPTSYAWAQTAGPVVALSDSTAPAPTFTAPADPDGATLTFSLVATNDGGTSAPDTVTVTVLPHLDWILAGDGTWKPTTRTVL